MLSEATLDYAEPWNLSLCKTIFSSHKLVCLHRYFKELPKSSGIWFWHIKLKKHLIWFTESWRIFRTSAISNFSTCNCLHTSGSRNKQLDKKHKTHFRSYLLKESQRKRESNKLLVSLCREQIELWWFWIMT